MKTILINLVYVKILIYNDFAFKSLEYRSKDKLMVDFGDPKTKTRDP